MGSLPKSKKKNIPKSINEMSKETLQETLKKKKECNARALSIVEKLCETYVEEEWFLANLQFINQCHFDDVTVERAISQLCGYPLCEEQLVAVPPQQYHISTRYNKVYDITERKNFCSSCCYKSAMYVKKQLFTSPLWFRESETIPKYKILKSAKSSMGEEVVFVPDKIKPEPDDVKNKENKKVINSNKKDFDLDNDVIKIEKKCQDLSLNKDSVDAKKEEALTSDSESLINDLNKNLRPLKEEKEDNKEVRLETKVEENKNIIINDISERNVCVNNNVSDKIPEPVSNNKSESSETVKTAKTVNVKKETKRTHIEPKPAIDPIEKIENAFFQWFSLNTFFHLYGEEKLKELLQDKADKVKEIINSKLSLAGVNDKFDKVIQLYGLLDMDSFRGSDIKTNLKPLPDYSVLKEEGKTLEIKVKAFYQGQLEVKKADKVEEKKEEEVSTDTEPIYLPLVDAHAQVALRRKIVLDKLIRVVPDVIKVFSLSYTLQMNEVRNLVTTFTLSAHNITFKPTEWYFVAIIIIKLLSLKNKELKSLISKESSKNQLSLVLSSYNLPKEYFDNLIFRLTDSTSLIKKLNDIDSK